MAKESSGVEAQATVRKIPPEEQEGYEPPGVTPTRRGWVILSILLFLSSFGAWKLFELLMAVI